MSLTSHPFHPVSNELLPGYRDAYLRGDLSIKNTELVDAYLKANPAKGGEAFQRFHVMQAKGHSVRPVGWLQNQFDLIRTEPARFRRRAGAVIMIGALISGASFAGTRLPKDNQDNLPALTATTVNIESAEATTEATAATRMTTVRGRILDENGHPLVGATVLDKLSGRGVSTDAQGNYALAVPANRASRLQFGYGGYDEAEVVAQGRAVQNMTLVPRQNEQAHTVKRHWWQF